LGFEDVIKIYPPRAILSYRYVIQFDGGEINSAKGFLEERMLGAGISYLLIPAICFIAISRRFERPGS